MARRSVRRFNIIEETPDYIVVDKPAPLLVHPSKPDGAANLWDELRHLLAFEIATGGQVSIVNRLDRETSGIVLVAKTAAAARDFSMRMQTRRIEKEYHALIWGWPEWDTIKVEAPLRREGLVRPSPIFLKQTIDSRGAPAETEFEVLERLTRSTANGCRFAWIKARPLTGRTHQIRVHLSALGHAVVGDKIYGPDASLYLAFIQDGWTGELARTLLLPRHALHATRLRLDDGREWRSERPQELHLPGKTTNRGADADALQRA